MFSVPVLSGTDRAEFRWILRYLRHDNAFYSVSNVREIGGLTRCSTIGYYGCQGWLISCTTEADKGRDLHRLGEFHLRQPQSFLRLSEVIHISKNAIPTNDFTFQILQRLNTGLKPSVGATMTPSTILHLVRLPLGKITRYLVQDSRLLIGCSALAHAPS